MDGQNEERAAIEEEKKLLDCEYEAHFNLLRRIKSLRSPPKGKQAELRQKIDALLDWAIVCIERELNEIMIDSQEVVDDKLEIDEEEFEGDDPPAGDGGDDGDKPPEDEVL